MENQRKAKEYEKKLVRLVTLVLKNRNGSQEGFTKRVNVSAALDSGRKQSQVRNARDARPNGEEVEVNPAVSPRGQQPVAVKAGKRLENSWKVKQTVHLKHDKPKEPLKQ